MNDVLKKLFDFDTGKVLAVATGGGVASFYDSFVGRATALCVLGYVALKFFLLWKNRKDKDGL